MLNVIILRNYNCLKYNCQYYANVLNGSGEDNPIVVNNILTLQQNINNDLNINVDFSVIIDYYLNLIRYEDLLEKIIREKEAKKENNDNFNIALLKYYYSKIQDFQEFDNDFILNLLSEKINN